MLIQCVICKGNVQREEAEEIVYVYDESQDAHHNGFPVVLQVLEFCPR